MDEPRIALAASPRGWAQALHRHVADHGGAVVRATVLHQQDAVAEDYDVFIGDDSTSFLTRRLVEELHRRGRSVLGVFDADDPRGKGELVDMGVDDVIARDEPPAAFLAAIAALHGRHRPRGPAPGTSAALPGQAAATPGQPADPVQVSPPGGDLVAVAAAGGGAGATEVAIALAHAGSRHGAAVVLVDADDVAPAVAQRLGLPLYPNVRAAIDALEHGSRPLEDLLTAVGGAGFAVLPGATNPGHGGDLQPVGTVDVLRRLAEGGRDVVVNVGPRVEDVSAGAAGGRYGLTRAVLAAADRIVVAAHPMPVGLARLLEWFGELRRVSPAAEVHVLFDRAPGSGFKRQELIDELHRNVTPAGVWFAPADARVEAAAWAGRLVGSGPFARAVAEVAASTLPGSGSGAGRRRRWTRS